MKKNAMVIDIKITRYNGKGTGVPTGRVMATGGIHFLPSFAMVSGGLHAQWNPPGSFTQRCSHPPLLVAHSFISGTRSYYIKSVPEDPLPWILCT